MSVGFIFNDIIDNEIDKINRPSQYSIGKTVSVVEARKVIMVLTLLIATLSVYLSVYVFVEWALIAIAVYSGLILYSLYFKQRPLIGNIIIAGLASFLPVVMLFYGRECINHLEGANQLNNLIITYALFTFSIILPREINLDMEDLEGDKKAGCKTLPILFGLNGAKIIVVFMVLLSIIFSIYWIVRFNQFLVPYLIIDLYLIYFCWILIKANDKKGYIRSRNHLRYVLFIGLVGFAMSILV